MSPTEISIDIPGLKLAARSWGTPSERRILALHGWLDNAATFDALAPLIENHQIVALDLPGHGLSEHRAKTASYEFVHWPVDVADVAHALGWERFRLLGHSMGAGISCLVAGTLTERIERMVLVDGIGPLSRPPEQAPAGLAKAIDDRRKWDKVPFPYTSAEDAARKLQQANPALDETAAQILTARGLMPDPEGDGYVWRYDQRLRARSMLRLSEAQVIAFLNAITCPTLMIRPENGWPLPEQAIERRVAAIKDGSILRVPGKHHVHLTDAETIAPAINAFLAD